ncbi:MAG: GNAT family N-acetyltransferase [Bdellovibrionales bacterium]|nr:GNAT family N-acetyltransferase [Bdellovibrionales bacterium]
MNLYRHYKNKLYKLKGVVKHSESLEDLVLYEALYPNALGSLWVRPRPMFFEDIEWNGNRVPRFAPISHRVVVSLEISEVESRIVSDLAATIFSRWDGEDDLERLKTVRNPCLVVVYIDDLPVGFKLGYEIDQQIFYSWLGGVKKEYRQLGLASLMMKTLVEWCGARGYKSLRTKTRNEFPEMMILNLKHGFKITKTYLSKDNQLRIEMEKSLE